MFQTMSVVSFSQLLAPAVFCVVKQKVQISSASSNHRSHFRLLIENQLKKTLKHRLRDKVSGCATILINFQVLGLVSTALYYDLDLINQFSRAHRDMIYSILLTITLKNNMDRTANLQPATPTAWTPDLHRILRPWWLCKVYKLCIIYLWGCYHRVMKRWNGCI